MQSNGQDQANISKPPKGKLPESAGTPEQQVTKINSWLVWSKKKELIMRYKGVSQKSREGIDWTSGCNWNRKLKRTLHLSFSLNSVSVCLFNSSLSLHLQYTRLNMATLSLTLCVDFQSHRQPDSIFSWFSFYFQEIKLLNPAYAMPSPGPVCQ